MKTAKVITFVFKQKKSLDIDLLLRRDIGVVKSFIFPLCGRSDQRKKKKKKGKENTNYFKRAFLQCNFYIIEKTKSCQLRVVR